MAQIKKYLKGQEITKISEQEQQINALLQDLNISEQLKKNALIVRQNGQNVINAEGFTARDERRYRIEMNNAIISILSGKPAYNQAAMGSAYKNIFGYYSRPETELIANETVRQSFPEKTSSSTKVGDVYEIGSQNLLPTYYWHWNTGFDPNNIRSDMESNAKVNLFIDTLIRNMTEFTNEDRSQYEVHNAPENATERFPQLIDTLKALKNSTDIKAKLDVLSPIVTELQQSDSTIGSIYNQFLVNELHPSAEVLAAQAVAARAGTTTFPEGYTQYTPTEETSAYTTHLTDKKYYIGSKDGKQYAFIKDDNDQLIPVTQEYAWMDNNFTNPTYKHGIFILPTGEIIWGNDLGKLRKLLEDAGSSSLYTDTYNRLFETDLVNKYSSFDPNRVVSNKTASAVNFSGFPTGKFIDLSNYFAGNDLYMGIIKDNSSDPYNWYNVTDNPIYKFDSATQMWVAQNLDAIKSNFQFAGNVDNTSNPNKDMNLQIPSGRGFTEMNSKWDFTQAFEDSSLKFEGIENATTNDEYIKKSILLSVLYTFKDTESLVPKLFSNVDNLVEFRNTYSKFGKEHGTLALIKSLIQGLIRNKITDADLQALNLPLPEQYNSVEKLIKNLLIVFNKQAKQDEEVQEHKLGGILKAEDGIALNPIFDQFDSKSNSNNTKSNLNHLDPYTRAVEISKTNDKSFKQNYYNNKTWDEFEFSTQDYLRIGALTTDLAGLIASFFPGSGTAVAAGAGVGSLALDLAADVKDPSVTKGEVVKNAGANLLFGVLGLIPGGKAWKIIKSITVYTPALISLGLIGSDLGNKIQEGKELTYEDYKNIYIGLSTLMNMGTNAASASKLKKLKAPEASKTGNIIVTDPKTGKDYTFSKKDIELIDKAGIEGGQSAAIEKFKQLAPEELKQNLEAITSISDRFNYGNAEKGKFADWRRRRNIISLSGKEETTPALDIVGEFYKDNPLRKGNPWNPNDWITYTRPKDRNKPNSGYETYVEEKSGLGKLFATDYQIAREGAWPITLRNYDFPRWRNFINWVSGINKGPNWAKKNAHYISAEGDPNPSRMYFVNIDEKKLFFVYPNNGQFKTSSDPVTVKTKQVKIPNPWEPSKFINAFQDITSPNTYYVQKRSNGKYYRVIKDESDFKLFESGGKLDRLTQYINNK